MNAQTYEYEKLEEEKEDAATRISSLESEKKDDVTLPEFVKEIPTKQRRKESGELVTIEYRWNDIDIIGDNLKIKFIKYKKGENFEGVYRINKKDGADSILLKHNHLVYILRKTTKRVAVGLLNIYKQLKDLVENVVGWLKTTFGNVYLIAKVDKGSWSFNEAVCDGPEINILTMEKLDEKKKSRICESITSKMLELHRKGLLLKGFSLNNVWLSNSTILFADLRNLKLAKKKSVFVEEFRKTLNYLFTIGMLDRSDVYATIAYYVAAMEENCSDWYNEKKGTHADHFNITLEIEKTIYN